MPHQPDQPPQESAPFDADPAGFRLALEAGRMRAAHLFDPWAAVHASAAEPLPHQIAAVYRDMLPRSPLRFLLADDPGAGKTVMAGLLIREMLARGDIRSCLVVAPGSLVEQWREELLRRFRLRFALPDAASLERDLAEKPLVIARLDVLARHPDMIALLDAARPDLAICDEAHRMSATIQGGEIRATRRFRLGRALSGRARNLLLLTATPHNGRDADFRLLLSLLDADRFSPRADGPILPDDLAGVMRRMVKEELRGFDGAPLFPERVAVTVSWPLGPEERDLYEAVTAYVRDGFNRAETLRGDRRTAVGFALSVIQRRLVSSPAAAWRTLKRRRERLEDILDGVHAPPVRRPADLPEAGDPDADIPDDDDLTAGEREGRDDRRASEDAVSYEPGALRTEIAWLRGLEAMARAVLDGGRDGKWDRLAGLLREEDALRGPDGAPRRLVVFTEHRDTLDFLVGRIGCLLGDPDAVAAIHGGLSRKERRRAEDRFRESARILVATDAAGEGVNLQCAHLMINYDLPWNPNRLEQRFGRIHRLGQKETCRLWNMVAEETREGGVHARLLEKLERERRSLGGKVFDILGGLSFDGRTLRELLVEAVRRGDDPGVRDGLDRALDAGFSPDSLARAANDPLRGIAPPAGDSLEDIREEMARMEARRLQPHFVEGFFLAAFRSLGGEAVPRGPGRHVIRRIPPSVAAGIPDAELDPLRGGIICFDRAHVLAPGCPPADLVAPGHPLLDAVALRILRKMGDAPERGAILVDDAATDAIPRLLLRVEHVLRDADGRVVASCVHFAEVGTGGAIRRAGPAPHLDLRPPSAEEADAAARFRAERAWPAPEDEEAVLRGFAAGDPDGLVEEARSRRDAELVRRAEAVRRNLRAECRFWDRRAAELRGRGMDWAAADARAEDAARRLKEGLAELERARLVTADPPRATARALVIPAGLLRRLLRPAAPAPDPGDRTAELAAVRAVMERERALGHEPRDVGAERRGYDVESAIPAPGGAPRMRFIEVKGRRKGGTVVEVTRNEILTALNAPESWILALVEVDGEGRPGPPIYLADPFHAEPDWGACAVRYDVDDLVAGARIVQD